MNHSPRGDTVWMALPNTCVNNPTWYISVLMICYAIVCYIVGTISYYAIERPAAKLIDKKIQEI